MAPAPSASAFPLHPNSCLLDEHDRMLFQHSHPTGTDAERTTLQEGVEGFSAAISKAIQPQSHALHLDQRAGTLPTHHRSNERVPGSSSQATKAGEDQPKYYKELTVRCTSRGCKPRLFKPVDFFLPYEVLGLYRERYFDLNVQHFHEKLRQEHGIGLSYTWVKQALQGAGMVKPGRQRGVHRRQPAPLGSGRALV